MQLSKQEIEVLSNLLSRLIKNKKISAKDKKNKDILRIEAFGKYVTRDKAIDIIINDLIGDYCYANNTDGLEELLYDGWVGLCEWSDEEIEEFISGLCIENQPGGKI